MPTLAAITIEVPPTFEVGPLEVAWHGVMIAIGILAGSLLAVRYARERGLEVDRLQLAVFIVVLAGMVGARFYYLVQAESDALLRPADWFQNVGFAFYGALIGGAAAVGVYLWRARLSLRYLDALAAGFPLGMAVGRIGDVINGEHYGPPTTDPWGFRYTDPAAEVPSTQLAYQSGAFYEVLWALAMLAVLWPLRNRLRPPGAMLWATIGLYSIGRFLIFFIIRDTPIVALGLRQAQWTSLALCAIAALGLWFAYRQEKPSATSSMAQKR